MIARIQFISIVSLGVCWKAFWMCSRSRFLHFARKSVGCSVLPFVVDCTMSGPCPIACVLPCLSLCAVFHPGIILNGRLGSDWSMLCAHRASAFPFLKSEEVVSLMALFRFYWKEFTVVLLCGHVTSAWAGVSISWGQWGQYGLISSPFA